MSSLYRLKTGTFKKLVENGWSSGVPDNIDGKVVEITNNFMDTPEPHMEVKLMDSDYNTPFGVPNGCLKLA